MPRSKKFEKAWVAMVEGLIDRVVSSSQEDALRDEARALWRGTDKAGRETALNDVRLYHWLSDLPASAAIASAGESLMESQLYGMLDWERSTTLAILHGDDPVVAFYPDPGLMVTRADVIAARAILAAEPGDASFDADRWGAEGIGAWEDEAREQVMGDDVDNARYYASLDAYAEGLEAVWPHFSPERRADALGLFDHVQRPSTVAQITNTDAGSIKGLMSMAHQVALDTLPVGRRDAIDVWVGLVEAVVDRPVKGADKKALKAEAKAMWGVMTDAERDDFVDYYGRMALVAEAGGGREAAGEDAVVDLLYGRLSGSGTALLDQLMAHTGAVAWNAEAGALITFRDVQAWAAIATASPDDDDFVFRGTSGSWVAEVAQATRAQAPSLTGADARYSAAMDVYAAGLERTWDGLSRAERADILTALHSGGQPPADLAQALVGASTVADAEARAKNDGFFDAAFQTLPESARLTEINGLYFSQDLFVEMGFADVIIP